MRPETPFDGGGALLTQHNLKDRPQENRRAHAWLEVARVFQLASPCAGLAALATLSDAGCRAFRRRGHTAVAMACFPSLDPARVRFLDPAAAPRLASGADGDLLGRYRAPWPDLPVILDQEPAGAIGARFRVRVPPDLRAVQGHFPDIPVVPGMAQVGWALSLAGSALGVSGRLAGIPAMKFQRIVQPGHELSLSLDWDPARRVLLFSLASNHGRHSGGRLVMGTADA